MTVKELKNGSAPCVRWFYSKAACIGVANPVPTLQVYDPARGWIIPPHVYEYKPTDEQTMSREQARQIQIDAGVAGKAVVGLSLEEAKKVLEEQDFTHLVDWQDGGAINTVQVLQLTIGRVRLQIEGDKVIGYAIG